MSATSRSESTQQAFDLLTAAFLRAKKTPFTDDPINWLEEHFRIPFSARSQRFKRDNAPHLSEIIRCAVALQYQKLVVRGATGAGKTTLLEATAVFNVGVEYGPMLLVGQTNEDVKVWVESRYMPIIDACTVLHEHLPEDRHKKRNDAVLWKHMAQYFTGANISGLQEKSIRFCYGDETWLWERGRVGELKARHHNRWNRKTILVSQGWETSSDEPHDMEAEYAEGDDRRREFQCPECGEWQLYAWEQIKYSPVLGTNFSIDKEKTGSTARMECRFCRHEIPDTSAARRSLAENARWTPYNAEDAARHEDGSIKVASFHCPAWVVWWIPWREIVIDWLKAQHAKKIGDLEPFRLWTMKVAAQPWVLDTTKITDSDVRGMVNSDYAQRTCPIEPALVTMCADVGERVTHYSVCAWSWDGECYVIDYGTTLAPINLIAIAQESQYPIVLNKQPAGMVAKVNVGLIDSGDFTEEIYTVCRSQSVDIFSPSKGSGAQFGRNVWHAQELKEYGGIVLYTYVDYHAKQELYINKIAKKTKPRLYFPADSSDEFLHGFTGQKIVVSDKGRREFKEIPWDHFGDTVKLHLVCWWVKRPRE
jgi:phage terminase large subunit GpA-like protein